MKIDLPVHTNLVRAGDFAEIRIPEKGGSDAKRVEETAGSSFASVLQNTVETASARGHDAAAKAEALAAGKSDDLHGTMISMKEAEISMKLVGAVRNKVLDAFHELWRINV